jgi:hypothetical protein
MLLVYLEKTGPRITYIFRHIFRRILGIEVDFTDAIETFIAYSGPKCSYGKKPLGNELFFQSHGLLTQQGVESVDITVKEWGDTVGFFQVSEKSALPFDIFAAGFYLLSRYEEYLPHVKDELGRFPASESLGAKNEFLEQPVIDIWAYKLKALLQQHFPEMVFPPRKSSLHTIIEAQTPYAYLQRGLFRTTIGYFSDLLKFRFKRIGERTSVVAGVKKDPNNTFEWLLKTAKGSKNRLSVFFMLGEALSFDQSFNTHREQFKLLVKYVADYAKVGLIFSYEALRDYELLKNEKKRMEDITNRSLINSMNARLLVNLPEFYRNLVELEIKEDFTMYYEDAAGFRAGTCTPFLFYDLDYEIKTPLIIHSIGVCTSAIKNKYVSDIEKKLKTLHSRVIAVNGTFCMVFSNTDFNNVKSNDHWIRIFSEIIHNHE